MKLILLLIAITIMSGCVSAPSQPPLCRHIVLSQYAAFTDAGYETEIWHMKNKNPAQAKGFKYHVAVRVKQHGKWHWVQQPSRLYSTTTQQPLDTELTRKIEFEEVSQWVTKRK